MSNLSNLSEQLAVVSVIDPDAYGTGTQDGDIIDMAARDRVLFIVQVGDIASSGVVDFVVYGSAAANFSTPGPIPGKAITSLTQAGTDSDKQAVVEVSAWEVGILGYRYIRGHLILTGAGADAAVIGIGGKSRFEPATLADLASVDEIVA